MELWTNNARTTLAAGISASDTALTVQTGYGSLFPNPASPDYFFATLYDGTYVEVIKVWARSGDTFTSIERAQQGTTARAWLIGDGVDHRLTAEALKTLQADSLEDIPIHSWQVLVDVRRALWDVRDLLEEIAHVDSPLAIKKLGVRRVSRKLTRRG